METTEIFKCNGKDYVIKCTGSDKDGYIIETFLNGKRVAEVLQGEIPPFVKGNIENMHGNDVVQEAIEIIKGDIRNLCKS
ncbi:MAG TPA: hypothetical protein VFF54_00505 [Thermodesulfobacteriota bacterium]|nr:hypothetical protein [Thermodesulfobacteriota bacterium]